MKITIKDILNLGVFSSYKVLSGSNFLKKIVESVSFIEVPDYTNYMVANSILITTLMNVKENEDFLYNFILDISAHNISALVIKDKGFFKPISKKTIDLANKLRVVIILLEDDCNLSHVMNNISNIIYSNQTTLNKNDLQNISLSEMFSKIETYPDLINVLKKINNIEFYIEVDPNTHFYTNSEFYNQINQNKTLKTKSLFKINNLLVLKKEIILNDKLYSTFYLSVLLDNPSITFDMNEYITFIILLIKNNNEKKMLENEVKLNNFIKNINIISEIDNSLYPVYNQIKFPLGILFFKNLYESRINNEFIKYLYKEIEKHFSVNNQSISLFITKKYTIFIFNIHFINLYKQSFYNFISNTFTKINIAFSQSFSSKIIEKGSDIEKVYLDSISLISLLENVPNLKPGIYLEDYDTLNLLKNVDENLLLNFMQNKLRGLFNYEKTNTELIETLNTLISSNFQLKTCAARLFIHYNTLRYRIGLLDNLGFDMKSINFNSTDVSIAISIYYFVYLPKTI